MDELDNLDTHDCESVLDMNADNNYRINTEELADEFGDSNLDDLINNLNDCE